MFQLLRKNAQVPSRGLTALSGLLSRVIPSLGRRASVGGGLEHLVTLPLTAQVSLALVRLHDETLLLGITAQSVTLLTRRRETEVDRLSVSRSNGDSLQEDQPRLWETSA